MAKGKFALMKPKTKVHSGVKVLLNPKGLVIAAEKLSYSARSRA